MAQPKAPATFGPSSLLAGALSASLFLGALSLGGCPAGSDCHASGQCASGLSCVGPNDARGCGIAPMRQCASDSDCSGGSLCNTIDDPCSPSGIGSRCAARCVACAAGFRCNAAGACEPLPCDQGYQCPSHQRCDPAVAHMQGPVYARTQGCVDIPCTADSDCPATNACVNSYCQNGVGSCQQTYAVP